MKNRINLKKGDKKIQIATIAMVGVLTFGLLSVSIQGVEQPDKPIVQVEEKTPKKKETKKEKKKKEEQKESHQESVNDANKMANAEETTYESNNGNSSESNVLSYPLTYSDATASITVYKENYNGSNVYAAHVQLSDYSRFYGAYLGGQVLSSVASDKILAINGDWAAPNGYTLIRNGQMIVQSNMPEGAYSAYNGLLWYGQSGYDGATETFCFGPAFLMNGSVIGGNMSSRAQRTFIGTTGVPGDLWLCVTDGRYVDGYSAGLTEYECAVYLQSKGCTFGVPLDGGGSTEMIFRGQILNSVASERPLSDALFIK